MQRTAVKPGCPGSTGLEDMTNLLGLSMIISWCVLVINNPIMMSFLFCQLLVLASCLVGRLSPFLGLMVFLVYIGGILILISYCVMLLPSNKYLWIHSPLLLFLITFAYPFARTPKPRSFSYGLLYRMSAILLLGIVLYYVLLTVVDIINYSSGMMKS